MIIIEPGILTLIVLVAGALGIIGGMYVERFLLAPPRADLERAKRQLDEAQAALAATRAKYNQE